MNREQKKLLSLDSDVKNLFSKMKEYEKSLKFIREKIVAHNRALNEIESRVAVLSDQITLVSEIKVQNKKILLERKHLDLKTKDISLLQEHAFRDSQKIKTLEENLQTLTDISDRQNSGIETLKEKISQISTLTSGSFEKHQKDLYDLLEEDIKQKENLNSLKEEISSVSKEIQEVKKTLNDISILSMIVNLSESDRIALRDILTAPVSQSEADQSQEQNQSQQSQEKD